MTPIKLVTSASLMVSFTFQSLFFWMTPIKRRPASAGARLENVSILVLLDDSHQEVFPTEIGSTPKSFNPCSSG